jgi:hypothetical protein
VHILYGELPDGFLRSFYNRHCQHIFGVVQKSGYFHPYIFAAKGPVSAVDIGFIIFSAIFFFNYLKEGPHLICQNAIYIHSDSQLTPPLREKQSKDNILPVLSKPQSCQHDFEEYDLHPVHPGPIFY